MTFRHALLPLLLAGPALAHPAEAPHLHDTDNLSLAMGLGLIVLGLGAGAYLRARRR